MTGVEGNLFDGTATSKDILNNMRVLERPLLFQPGDRWCKPAATCPCLAFIFSHVRVQCILHKAGFQA